MSDVAVEEFLEHFGTKGMKWGVRNKRPESTPKMSRRERKAEVKKLQLEIDTKRVMSIIDESLKDKTLLINLNGRAITTGEEFTRYALSGGRIDAKTTSIYARRDPKSDKYIIQ